MKLMMRIIGRSVMGGHGRGHGHVIATVRGPRGARGAHVQGPSAKKYTARLARGMERGTLHEVKMRNVQRLGGAVSSLFHNQLLISWLQSYNIVRQCHKEVLAGRLGFRHYDIAQESQLYVVPHATFPPPWEAHTAQRRRCGCEREKVRRSY